MKILLWVLGIVIVLVVLFYAFNSYIRQKELGDTSMRTGTPNVQVIPIRHASAVIRFDDAVIYTDPEGDFSGQPAPTIVLVTDIHPDHLSTTTLASVLGNAALIVPQAVKDMLPPDLAAKAQVLSNGESTTENDFEITAIPMYNLPESPDAYHVKGRGNGYVIERDDTRVYVAGDTAGIPEMRALKDIAIALIPMNLPYTMGVEEAADAVLAFAPKQVYPYHYRGQDGLSDVNHFKELVNAGNPDIDVVLLNWYP